MKYTRKGVLSEDALDISVGVDVDVDVVVVVLGATEVEFASLYNSMSKLV